MISVYFQGKSFNVAVIQVYVATTNAKEAEVEWFYEDLQNLLVKVKVLVTQLPPTLCDVKDYPHPLVASVNQISKNIESIALRKVDFLEHLDIKVVSAVQVTYCICHKSSLFLSVIDFVELSYTGVRFVVRTLYQTLCPFLGTQEIIC